MGRTLFRTAVTAVCCAVVLCATGGTAAAHRPEPRRPHVAKVKPKPPKAKADRPKAKPRPRPHPTAIPVPAPVPPRPGPPRPPDRPDPAHPDAGARPPGGNEPFRRPIVAPPPGPFGVAKDTVKGVKLLKPSSPPVVEPSGEVLPITRPTAAPTAADLVHASGRGGIPLWLLLLVPLAFVTFAAGIVLGRRRT